MRTWRILWIMSLVVCLWPPLVKADSRSDTIQTGLINDPEKGYKGFTSALFEQEVLAEFQSRTGINLKRLDGAAVLTSPSRFSLV